MRINRLLIPVIIISFTLPSCVPSRMYDDLKTRNANCEDELEKLKGENLKLGTQNDELSITVNDLKRDLTYLKKDTASLGSSNRKLTSLYDELSRSYEKLLANNDKFLAENQSESRKLILELQQTQEELLHKEDSLKQREKVLADLTYKLEQRERRVNELEDILTQNERETKALREKISKALVGFENEGLTVYQKDGRVYVSLEEKLLFASGSTSIDLRGEEALSKLAKILEQEKEIRILIEGHTDDVPIKGGPVKDNWDLSVLRSTSVVRVLMENGNIDPVRLTPAGKGEYVPVDPAKTTEARKRNRRIEIILTPNYDELVRVLELK